MRKKSPAKSLAFMKGEMTKVRQFISEAEAKGLSGSAITFCYDFCVIWAYRSFEGFVLDVAVAQINHNPAPFYEVIGANFGSHLTASQCEYLLVGDKYFDFRGHGGLVDVVRKAAGAGSALETAVKAPQGRKAFEILVGLRNYTAHLSDQSKLAALRAMRHWEPNRQNLGTAGNWLSVNSGGRTRMERLLTEIEELCTDMANAV